MWCSACLISVVNFSVTIGWGDNIIDVIHECIPPPVGGSGGRLWLYTVPSLDTLHIWSSPEGRWASLELVLVVPWLLECTTCDEEKGLVVHEREGIMKASLFAWKINWLFSLPGWLLVFCVFWTSFDSSLDLSFRIEITISLLLSKIDHADLDSYSIHQY